MISYGAHHIQEEAVEIEVVKGSAQDTEIGGDDVAVILTLRERERE